MSAASKTAFKFFITCFVSSLTPHLQPSLSGDQAQFDLIDKAYHLPLLLGCMGQWEQGL